MLRIFSNFRFAAFEIYNFDVPNLPKSLISTHRKSPISKCFVFESSKN